MAAERDEQRVDDQAASRLEAGGGHEHDRDPGTRHQLQHTGGDAPLPQRTEMPEKPTVGPHRGEVVDEPQEPEAEHREQHLAPGERQTGVFADAERAEDGPPGLDDQHGDDDVETTCRRDDMVAVVATFESR